MTWLELIEKLDLLPSEALRTDVTININDEFYKINGGLFMSFHTDILDKGHLFLAAEEITEEG